MNFSKEEIKKHIEDFIRNNGIMTLAVSENDTPWVCTMYYGIDEDLNLYIVTDPNSEHGKILEGNKNVAVNIYDSHTKITESKKGVQCRGSCEIIKNPAEMLKALQLWHKNNPGIENKITLEDVKKVPDTRLYKIKLNYLKFFNKELYGSDEHGIVQLT